MAPARTAIQWLNTFAIAHYFTPTVTGNRKTYPMGLRRRLAYFVLTLLGMLPASLQATRIAGAFALDLPADFKVLGDADVARLESAPAKALPSVESHGALRAHPKWVRVDQIGRAHV